MMKKATCGTSRSLNKTFFVCSFDPKYPKLNRPPDLQLTLLKKKIITYIDGSRAVIV